MQIQRNDRLTTAVHWYVNVIAHGAINYNQRHIIISRCKQLAPKGDHLSLSTGNCSMCDYINTTVDSCVCCCLVIGNKPQLFESTCESQLADFCSVNKTQDLVHMGHFNPCALQSFVLLAQGLHNTSAIPVPVNHRDLKSHSHCKNCVHPYAVSPITIYWDTAAAPNVNTGWVYRPKCTLGLNFLALQPDRLSLCLGSLLCEHLKVRDSG